MIMGREAENLLKIYKKIDNSGVKSLIEKKIVDSMKHDEESWREFEIIEKPQGKERPRVVHSKNSRVIAFTPQKTIDYEELVKLEYLCKYGRNKPFKGAVSVEVVAVYEIPKSTTKKRRVLMLNDEVKPLVKPDIDNVLKIVLDGLNGIAYEDDKQVTESYVRKEYGKVPKVKVRIRGGGEM